MGCRNRGFQYSKAYIGVPPQSFSDIAAGGLAGPFCLDAKQRFIGNLLGCLVLERSARRRKTPVIQTLIPPSLVFLNLLTNEAVKCGDCYLR